MYDDTVNELVIGMMSALIGAGFWIVLASIYAMPISTTHAIVGSIVSFALFEKGPSWYVVGSQLF